MSFKLIGPTPILNNVDISTTKTSSGIQTLNSDNIGIQVIWTGTPTGTLSVQASNTASLGADGTVSGGTWSNYTATVPTIAGSAGNGLINLNQFPFAFMRLIYTASSGSGGLTAVLVAKPV